MNDKFNSIEGKERLSYEGNARIELEKRENP